MTRLPWATRALIFAGRIFLALVFAIGGVAKWVDPGQGTLQAVEPGRGWGATGSWAVLVSVVELLVALVLLTRFWRVGAVLSAGLGLVFLIVILTANWQGLDTSRCGCLGRVELQLRDHLHLIGAIILVSLGCASIRGHTSVGGLSDGRRAGT